MNAANANKKVIAIAGATGAVGKDLLEVLEKRNFPIADLKLLASSRSAGKKITFKGKEYTVETLTADSFTGVDIALFSAGGSRSKEFAQAAVKAGAVVVDNSSAFRMDPEVPLVIPEINPGDVKKHKGIIANPNCSTIIMLMALYPLHLLWGLDRVVVSTYQAASGAGLTAMEELLAQSKAVVDGQPVEKNVFPYQIAFNLFSHNTTIGENGYNEEEMKMVKETHKILADSAIGVTATCIRVPVSRAHSESINVRFNKKPDIEQARAAIDSFDGCKIVDDRSGNYFPMPLEATGQDDCLVGRLRYDISDKEGKTLDMFVCGDQVLKGAALNAVQIAELLL